MKKEISMVSDGLGMVFCSRRCPPKNSAKILVGFTKLGCPRDRHVVVRGVSKKCWFNNGCHVVVQICITLYHIFPILSKIRVFAHRALVVRAIYCRLVSESLPGFNSSGILAFWKLQSEPEQRLMATKVPECHRVHFYSVL